jgi:antitoxin component YwqK of YwqJK toxin-antitoxin module
MLKISGRIMKVKLGLKQVIKLLLIFILCSCAKNERHSYNTFQEKVDSVYYLQYALDSMIVFAEIGQSKTLNRFIFMDLQGNRIGNSMEYYADGSLKKRSKYVNGKQHGEEHIFDEAGNLIWYYNYSDDEKHGTMYEYYIDGNLKQHKIFDNGHPLYSAFYEDKIKHVEIIHPEVISEKITDGNYELMGHFKFPFLGNISGRIDSLPSAKFVLTDKFNFKITIPNAKDLKAFRVDFNFIPAEGDTVQFSEYGYRHEVKNE